MNIQKFIPLGFALLLILACSQFSTQVISTSTPAIVSTDTETPFPIVNDIPTSLPVLFLINGNTNCRQGPGQAFSIIDIINKGETVEVIGRNADTTWLFVASNILADNCWVSIVTGNIVESPSGTGDLGSVNLVFDSLTQVPIVTVDDPRLKIPDTPVPKDKGVPCCGNPPGPNLHITLLPPPSFAPPVLP